MAITQDVKFMSNSVMSGVTGGDIYYTPNGLQLSLDLKICIDYDILQKAVEAVETARTQSALQTLNNMENILNSMVPPSLEPDSPKYVPTPIDYSPPASPVTVKEEPWQNFVQELECAEKLPPLPINRNSMAYWAQRRKDQRLAQGAAKLSGKGPYAKQKPIKVHPTLVID